MPIIVMAPAISVIALAISVIAFAITVIAFADHQGCTRNQSDFICNHSDFTRTPPARKNQLHGVVTNS
jgi:hypothetical protein